MSKLKINGDVGILHTTYLDNKFIDTEYKKLLENLVNEDEYFYTVYALGEWSALKVSGRIYKKFSDKNIIEYLYNPEAVINLCCDFNYNPMKWALIQQEGGDDIVFDEVVQYDTDTETMCKELLNKYPGAVYRVFGDYSGTSRSTRRRSTDYDIIRNTLNIKQENIFVKPNPAVIVRFNLVNWRLCNNKDIRKLFVSKNCEHVIKDFRRVVYKKNEKIEDQTTNPDLSHISSAIGYYINYKYTLKELLPSRISKTV